MDTISRENNSMLPIGGIIVGAIGLLLGGIALVQISKVNKTLTDHQVKIDKVDAIETAANTASANADKANAYTKQVYDQTNKAFTDVGNMIGDLRGSITKIEDAMKKPVATVKGSSGPVVAGPGEYVIKPGDTFSKIGAAQGFKAADIAAVNPGVDSGKLKIGQKIKLPKK